VRIRAVAESMAEGERIEDAWRRCGLPAFAVATVVTASRGSCAEFADAIARAAGELRLRYIVARERLLAVAHPLALLAIGGLVALNLAAITQVSIYVREAQGLW
jgi:O-antigen/teichoic acid export membrane protein